MNWLTNFLRRLWASLWPAPTPGPSPQDGGSSPPAPPDNPTPSPPDVGEGPEDFRLADVKWVHGKDIASWPTTATLGAVEIHLPHICSTGVSWPAKWPKLGAKEVQANHVVIAKIKGEYRGGAWEALNVRAANTCRPLECLTKANPAGLGPFGQVKQLPFGTWHPKSGDWIGFMITSVVRPRIVEPVGRSRVVWVKWV